MRNFVARALLLSSLVAASAMAGGLYVGGELGYNFKNETGVYDDPQPQIGLKVGYDFGTFRAYGSYFYGFEGEDSHSRPGESSKIKWKTHDFLAGADFTPELFGRFKLILGGYTGFSVLSVEERIAYSPTYHVKIDENLAGFTLGGKIGALYEVGSNSEIEMGFKASKTWYDNSDYIGDPDGRRYGVYAGYNYKF